MGAEREWVTYPKPHSSDPDSSAHPLVDVVDARLLPAQDQSCSYPEFTGKISGTGWSSIMSSLADRAIVKKEQLGDVVRKDPYEINNKHDDKYNPFPPSKIVQLAEKLVGREFCYFLLRTNCEHFVNELRYGGQAEKIQPGDSRKYFSAR